MTATASSPYTGRKDEGFEKIRPSRHGFTANPQRKAAKLQDAPAAMR
jgi:hypothetical protein